MSVPAKKNAPKKKGKGGRPKKEVDLDAVRELASMDASYKQMAKILGVAKSTLQDREDIQNAIEEGRARGEVGLKRAQYATAVGCEAEGDEAREGEDEGGAAAAEPVPAHLAVAAQEVRQQHGER